MSKLESVLQFKRLVQDIFDNNEESLQRYGETRSIQLKTYLVESTIRDGKVPSFYGDWQPLDSSGWYVSNREDANKPLVLDATGKRVWRLFSLLSAGESDSAIENWIGLNRGLDYCWLQRSQLFLWRGREGWNERGVGIRFDDGLSPEDRQGYFSLKAWHGSDRLLPRLQDVITEAQGSFAIYSVRWERRSAGTSSELVECYSNGKITVNRAEDVEEALHFSSEIAERYEGALVEAEAQRNRKIVPFELDFSQEINLDAFSSKVQAGRGPMNLWLKEVESQKDFRRFHGVDLHTGDRMFLDLGPTYAYLSVPTPGCVNAAPRLAVIQGEDNAGKTTILQDGVEVFG